MTFDQAKEAFREHKTCESADAYLHNAVLHKAADLIGAKEMALRQRRQVCLHEVLLRVVVGGEGRPEKPQQDVGNCYQ
jgi:hypothetical protein